MRQRIQTFHGQICVFALLGETAADTRAHTQTRKKPRPAGIGESEHPFAASTQERLTWDAKASLSFLGQTVATRTFKSVPTVTRRLKQLGMPLNRIRMDHKRLRAWAIILGLAGYASYASNAFAFAGAREIAVRGLQRPVQGLPAEWEDSGMRDEAEALAHEFQSEAERAAWLERLNAGTHDWREVKLALGMLWQKAAEEKRDGGPLGYPMALSRLLDCYWVGSLDFNFLVEIKVFSTTPPKK